MVFQTRQVALFVGGVKVRQLKSPWNSDLDCSNHKLNVKRHSCFSSNKWPALCWCCFFLLDWYQVLPPNGKANELRRAKPIHSNAERRDDASGTAPEQQHTSPLLLQTFSIMHYHRCCISVYTIALQWADWQETIFSSHHLLSWARLRGETILLTTWCTGRTQSC